MQAWNSHFQGEVDKTEIVKIRATTIPIGFEKLKYGQQLKIFRLNALKNKTFER